MDHPAEMLSFQQGIYAQIIVGKKRGLNNLDICLELTRITRSLQIVTEIINEPLESEGKEKK